MIVANSQENSFGYLQCIINYRWKIGNEIFCVNFFSQIKELEKQKKAADVYLAQIMRKLVCRKAPIDRSLLDLLSS